MNLFFRELRTYSKSLFFWCMGMAFIIASGMGKYSGLAASTGSMDELIAQMPKAVQAVMGFNGLDLSKAIGYYGVLFSFLALMGAVHALMLGSNIILKEERDKTAEFLFVRPVSRQRVMLIKMAAALINVLILNAVTAFVSLFAVNYFSVEGKVTETVLLLMIGLLILQLIFLFMGFCTAAVSKNSEKSGAALAILLTAYVLSKMIDLNERLSFLRYLTPFKYFDAKDLVKLGRIDTVFGVLSAVLIIILAVLSCLQYAKRDLKI